MNNKKTALTLLTAFAIGPSLALACDPCALYNAGRLQGNSAGSFTLSISEQYTSYDRADGANDNSTKDGELVRGFSTTQLSVGYDLSQSFGLQLTLPFLARRFDKIENFRTSTESDSGLGDMSLAANYNFYEFKDQDSSFIAGLTAGVKFPTGDTGALEDFVADESDLSKHHTISSGSGGRALTFGSGSYDSILGVNFLARQHRAVLLSYAQYTVRTEGDFDYEFADDLLFNLSPGYYLSVDHGCSIAGLLTFSGEFKASDRHEGNLVTGSKVSNLYLGPALAITTDNGFTAEVGVDFRITDEDENSTVVPTTRLRAAIGYRFG